MHFPSPDVQLQWEQGIPLGGGPKRQHSRVQALQEDKGNVKKVKEMLQEVRMTIHMSLLIKHGPVLEPAIRHWLQGCQLQAGASSHILNQSSKQFTFLCLIVVRRLNNLRMGEAAQHAQHCATCTQSAHTDLNGPRTSDQCQDEHMHFRASVCFLPCIHTVLHAYMLSTMHTCCLPCIQALYHAYMLSTMHACCLACIHAVYHAYMLSGMHTHCLPCIHAVYHAHMLSTMHTCCLPCIHAVYHAYMLSTMHTCCLLYA